MNFLEDGHEGHIEYRMDPPKHEFLSYLVHARGYLLHGTGSPQLERLRPTRATDYDARSLDAVFATSDGIWPLFFATLDRERAGSLWNGCLHVRRGGVLRRYYFFFTEADPRGEQIWRNGAIYVVPREPFVRTWIPNEWACPKRCFRSRSLPFRRPTSPSVRACCSSIRTCRGSGIFVASRGDLGRELVASLSEPIAARALF